ncbi:GNAT family N-acetyltransferase [Curtobacterium sp. MCLR17_036]|uniref:GNAT family N-acetyltransferase n=1 Tax=Curtobacterium sp. MCLR17_036 TaxID=2175620 RepID=UPI000DA79256|nr:GNAT family N-acetyltransferase [Curtobacterium sp. MCLR17_036]WIE64854.1 GNAT family N-acetyltransferase [Curtobacterium sp. MCLR17_036]
MAPIRFSTARDAEEWDALVALSPGATGFHDWSWLQLQADVFGWRFEPLVVSDGDEPVGVFPVLLRSGWTRRPAEPPFPFVGPLVPPALLTSTLRAFRRWQVGHAVPVARFDLGPAVVAAAGVDLARAGVEQTPDRTYVVDLVGSSPEQIVASMKKGARYSLRAAGRNAVEVRPALPGELTALLPQVLGESYRSRGVPSPYPEEIGARVERWAAGRDDVLVTTAVVAGEPGGVIVALASHPVVTGWAGGTLRAHRAANPSTALFHDLLVWSLRRGHTAVDLVGHVDDGIARFKTSLGATERAFVNVVSSPLPRVVRTAAAAVRVGGAR